MDAGTALDEALDRLRSRSGLLLLVAFAAVGVATVVGGQTLLEASLTEYLALGRDPAQLPIPPEEIRPVRLALPVGYWVALAAFGGVALVSEYVSVVALRRVAGTSLREAATRRAVRAVVVGFLVGVVVKSVVLVGLAALLLPGLFRVLGLLAFVLPGLFLAVSLLFAHARVALEDEGPVAALAGSWELTSGRRLRVGGVVALLAVLYLTPRLLAVLVPAEVPGLLLGGILAGAANLVSAALVARAYVGFREEGAGSPEEDADEPEEDPYDAPLGPDDLPEP